MALPNSSHKMAARAKKWNTAQLLKTVSLNLFFHLHSAFYGFWAATLNLCAILFYWLYFCHLHPLSQTLYFLWRALISLFPPPVWFSMSVPALTSSHGTNCPPFIPLPSPPQRPRWSLGCQLRWRPCRLSAWVPSWTRQPAPSSSTSPSLWRRWQTSRRTAWAWPPPAWGSAWPCGTPTTGSGHHAPSASLSGATRCKWSLCRTDLSGTG